MQTLAALAASVPSAAAAEGGGQASPLLDRIAYVGSRTSAARNGHGKGLSVYAIDPASGGWRLVQLLEGLVNPSFLAFDRSRRFLYAVHGDESQVSAFRIDRTDGRLLLLGTQTTGGRNPVHLATDPTNRWLVIANYASGSVSVLARRDDGTLEPPRVVLALPGEPGPRPEQRTGCHPHEVAWDRARRFLVVPDKGADQLVTLTLDPRTGRLALPPGGVCRTAPGSGPRHVVFHPTLPLAFASFELSSQVGAFHYDAGSGRLAAVGVASSVPDGYAGQNTAAEIDISRAGDVVMVSNRGHDSVAFFRVDGSGGLRAASWTPCGGRGPRFMTLSGDGDCLFVANELSDTITRVGLGGRWAAGSVGTVADTGTPVCILLDR